MEAGDRLEEEFRKLERQVRQRECVHPGSIDISTHGQPMRYRCKRCGLEWDAETMLRGMVEEMADVWASHPTPGRCKLDILDHAHAGPRRIERLKEIHRAEATAYQEERLRREAACP